MKPIWSRKLARPLALKDGADLITLQDAADAVQRLYGATTRFPALESAIPLLMMAAETGKRTDITAATDALHRILRGDNHMR